MQQEYRFKITLLVSLLIHIGILASLPFFKNMPQKKELTNLEITYRKVSNNKARKDSDGISKKIKPINQKKLPSAKLPSEESKIKQPFKFDLSKLIKPKETIIIPKPKDINKLQKSQRIKLRDLPIDASKDPAYLNYRDIIRRKIQDNIYYYSDQFFYFDNPNEGKIFVSFTIKSNGILKYISINHKKSTNDNLLKKIVLTAVRNSSPFEKFPNDLRYKNRAFNLEISFEIE